MIAEVDALYERFEFAKIADVLYHFAWDEVCDWYIELAKLVAGRRRRRRDTRRVLGEVLDTLLRLLHPMVPFVTEALWTALTGGESVVDRAVAGRRRRPRRRRGRGRRSPPLQAVVTEVRRFRSDQGLKPAQRVPARLSGAGRRRRDGRDPRAAAPRRARRRLHRHRVARRPPAASTSSSTCPAPIDVAAERARLGKDLAAAEKEQAANAGKLGNEAFTGKAPEAVVAKVRARGRRREAEIARIEAASAPPSRRRRTGREHRGRALRRAAARRSRPTSPPAGARAGSSPTTRADPGADRPAGRAAAGLPRRST